MSIDGILKAGARGVARTMLSSVELKEQKQVQGWREQGTDRDSDLHLEITRVRKRLMKCAAVSLCSLDRRQKQAVAIDSWHR